jgi:hypothetical protein
MPGGVILELKTEEEFKKERVQQSLEVEISWNKGNGSQESVMLG